MMGRPMCSGNACRCAYRSSCKVSSMFDFNQNSDGLTTFHTIPQCHFSLRFFLLSVSCYTCRDVRPDGALFDMYAEFDQDDSFSQTIV